MTAPGGPTITVVIRQGPMILNCCVCDAMCAVAIGYVQTLSGLTTTPDQAHQRTERSVSEIGQCVQHVTTAAGQLKVLNQLSEGAPTASGPELHDGGQRYPGALVNLRHAAVVARDDTAVTRTAANTTWRRPGEDARDDAAGIELIVTDDARPAH